MRPELLCMYNVYNKYITLLFIENCALLGVYAASSCDFLPAFWYNQLVPSASVNNLARKLLYQDGVLCGMSVGSDIIVSRFQELQSH